MDEQIDEPIAETGQWLPYKLAWWVREEAAQNATNVELLRYFAEDDHWAVRVAVALNKLTPQDVSIRFLEDHDPLVREAARTIKFSANLLSGLVNNRAAATRIEAARNPWTSMSSLMKLTNDRAATVRKAAEAALAARKAKERAALQFVSV